ncbi:MAG: hypothetical protein JWM64_263, partial [Frankiales bacterium]|nr:hypothetical protein [Frankiales bacterium]
MLREGLLLGIVVGLLAGCGGDAAGRRLSAAREVWTARHPASYAFRISDAVDGGTTLVVRVQDGRADVRTA